MLKPLLVLLYIGIEIGFCIIIPRFIVSDQEYMCT